MAKVPLIQTKDGFYKTRRLRAGDRYLASPVDAIVLTQLRKVARLDYDAPVREALPQLPQKMPQLPQSEQVASALALADLRAEAETLGIRIDRRWAEGRLRQEIDSAKAKATAPTEPVAEPVAEPVPTPEPAAPVLPPEEPQPSTVEPTVLDEHAVAAETTVSSGLFSGGGGWRR